MKEAKEAMHLRRLHRHEQAICVKKISDYQEICEEGAAWVLFAFMV